MLFPNHPDYAIIGPHMGYAPGARTFGYAAGSNPMGYAPGARSFMGEVSTDEMNSAIAAGLDPNTLHALSAAGATDADIEELMLGDTDVPTLMSKYAGLVTTEGTTVTHTGSPAEPDAGSHSSGGTSHPQIPSGSTILYTVHVNTPPLTSAQNILDAISPLLPSNHMSLQSSQVSSSGSVSGPAVFSAIILDSGGNALVSDAKGYLDGLVSQFLGAGNLQLQSTVTVVSPGTTASGTPANTVNDGLIWMGNHLLYIGAGIAGFVLLRDFLGHRRR